MTATAQRWQHNSGSTTVAAQEGELAVESPEVAERNEGDSAHEEERGSRF